MSDLISRQAVKEWLAKWEGYIDADIIARMQYRIIDIPSAELATNLQPCNQDCISRQAVYNVLDKMPLRGFKKDGEIIHGLISLSQVNSAIINLPSAQPEPLSDAYTKAVWTWLLDYQIKTAELNGRYTPYEVLSWVANDWRKEHGRSDKQKSGD